MNSALYIRGGNRLHGQVQVHGAKNSVLPILAATVMGKDEIVISNCPDLKDVDSTVRILRHLGCRVTRDGPVLVVDPRTMCRYDVPDCLMREMRSSMVFLGAILARAGQASISFPGGCELGPRPIDLHLSSLRALGTRITEEGGNVICEGSGLSGTEISLSFPSVGATQNIMLAACAAKGQTRIVNAAREPEIEDLQEFLCVLGAKVSGAGTSTVVIEGRQPLGGGEHAILPDRIVAATYLCAAAVAGGDITVTAVEPAHLSTIISTLMEAGCEVNWGRDFVRLQREKTLKAMRPVRTMPYPGFPTDAQSPMMAVACLAQGTTMFVENIFLNRYRHVGELMRLGADIKVEGHVAVVYGVPHLYGTSVSATDLRGGASLVVAALGAEGESRITGLCHIDRGYAHLENALSSLGADIRRDNQ